MWLDRGKYKEICYRREEDIVDLEYKTREDILGDDLNAKVDEWATRFYL